MTEEKKVLREIIQSIYKIDTEQYEILDMILDRYTGKVHFKQINNDKYIQGTYENEIVSIEKDGLLELYDIFYEILM